jgi:hypothetical protein
MLLGSESIRHVDFSDALAKSPSPAVPAALGAATPHPGCEIVPPIILLIRSLQSRCKSIILNGNHLGQVDVSELCKVT